MEEIKKIEIQDTIPEEQPEVTVPETVAVDALIETPKENSRKKKILSIVLIVLLIILVGGGVLVGLPVLNIVNKAKIISKQGTVLKESLKSKDLKQISAQLKTTRADLDSLKNSVNALVYLKFVPFAGSYQSDAVHMLNAGEAGFDAAELVVKAIEPYADLLGLSGGQVGTGEKTAKDRISFIVSTLDKIGPDLDQIGAKVEIVKQEMDNVDPNRYPVEFKGYKVRELLTEGKTLIDQGASIMNDAKPVVRVMPWLLGVDAPRKYLMILQNDAELRPTGGFMTAYAILQVENGKITPLLSEDIYDVDARFRSKVKAPQAFVSYLPLPYATDPYLRLRDMNVSPDFKVSMEMFTENFKKASSQKFDGVIAVDTEVLVRLLAVIGRIGVPGWGNFSAEPDKRCFGCPLVVYELEALADKPVNTLKVARKAVIGPLMHSVLANALGSPKEKIPGLFDAGFSSVTEKHVLFYFSDEKIQSAMEAFNLAGRVRDYDKDYFYLIDTSFSGAKSNLFITNEVEQKVEVSNDGTITKSVTINYKNPFPASNCNLEKGDLCLNAPYRDWFRIYVPKGSTLIESTGSEVEIKTYEELGKTVFEGFFGNKYPLRPEGQAKLTIKYQLPFKNDKGEYRILIQKQPGTKESLYSILLGKNKKEINIKSDTEVKIKI